MPQIAEALLELNPWWTGPFRLDYKDRELSAELKTPMKMRHVVALTGLRRVGKTTLMMKLAEDELRRGLDPRRILHYSFDESAAVDIRSLLRQYEVATHQDARSGRLLVLLDEVQKLEDWASKVKAQYDRFPNLKFIVTGSESLFIRRGSTESLGGRIFEFKVDPLSFREYLTFAGIPFEPPGLHVRELRKALAAYTITQGFPELVGVEDRATVRRYLREAVIERVLFRDLPQLIGLKEVATIESIFNLLLEEPGQLLDFSGLSRDLGVERHRVSASLNYLERSYLVRKLYNYSGSRRKVERKLRKWYPTVVSPSLAARGDDFSKSRVLEWLVVNQVQAEYFWRDAYQKEVDIVAPGPARGRIPAPVEVKYGRIEMSGMAAFMRKHKVARGWIVSDEREEVISVDGRKVDVVPAYKFLLKPPFPRET
jgi:hypothetical protein